MLIVVDVESSPHNVVGIFQRIEEDTVIYNEWESGELSYAPYDCVQIVEGFIKYRGPGGLQIKPLF